MALAKLWNAFFGKRDPAEQSVAAVVPKSIPPIANPRSTTQSVKLADVKLAGTKPLATSAALPEPLDAKRVGKHSRRKNGKASASKTAAIVVTPEAEPAPAPVVRMFRKKTTAWTPLVGASPIRTILDLNVGDAKRATELMQTILDGEDASVGYITISLFEMRGGEIDANAISVREFHKRIRASGGNPTAIPMPLVEGLRRLSQTIGTVDLIIIDGNESDLATDDAKKWLARVMTLSTVVVSRDVSGRWQTTAKATMLSATTRSATARRAA